MLLLALFACATDDGNTTEDTAGVTYYADVRPILDKACVRCHTDDGIAPVSFDDPAQAAGLASAMVEETAAGRMPPPAPDATCRDYESSERFSLTNDEKATLAAWADAGAPLGDEADAPGAPDLSLTSLAPYDQEVWASKPYTPQFTATDGNDYRCFLIDLGNTETTYLTALQAIIDNKRIVHHVVLFSPAGTDDLWGEGDPHDGFSCGGLGQGNWQTLGAWGPGANPTVLPEGMGIMLAPDAHFVLQMHYFNSFEGADLEQDQSGYGLMLSDSVNHVAVNYAAGPTDFTIPAGDASYTARDTYPWYGESQILSVWPHMHLLGAGFEEVILRADGSEDCLLRMDGWDFHNQVTANFLEPVALGTGDRMRLKCTYDNSAENPNQYYDPPQDINFGEGTTDEMCFGFTLIADGSP
jgi:hypothetical protein